MAEIYKEIVFLNSKHKETAEGACCLTRYEISVGKVHIYKKQHIVPQC